MGKYWKKWLGLLGILCMVILLPNRIVYANNPYVTYSPDGEAFTVMDGETDVEWYEKGTEVSTGISGGIRECRVGEHIYTKYVGKEIPVEKWVVNWSEAKCIHKDYPAGDMFFGVRFQKNNCMKNYFSGWIAYCADCKETVATNNIYMSREAARSMKSLDLSKAYYYKCPHCDNLEQGIYFNQHACKGISINRYFVRYHANFGNGYMEKSTHIVNNETIYEGQEVTPQTTLNLNTYTRKGYVFAGWNTKRDGSGTSFKDGAKILNLSMEQNDNVILYAQWKKCESVLEIDPAGGSYKKDSGITQIKGEYAETYVIDMASLEAPKGYTVHFDTQGGKTIADRVGKQIFVEWSCSVPFQGELKDGTYHFSGADGSVDRIRASYGTEAILLPEAVREGFSFGGWFADAECTVPVGEAGDRYIPKGETTLYAAWVNLLLTAEDNYTANQGKGAVDLNWVQKDAVDKVYQVFQKTEDSEWELIDETQGKYQEFEVIKNMDYTGNEGNYIVPYTGFYVLTLNGAQGGNYGKHQGGKGGCVQAVCYLERGEKLTYQIGGQNGYSGGGAGKTYANGGGFSKVTSQKQGVLLVAGGGGGAADNGDGYPGGSEAQLILGESGESGEAGGGGGYYGGASGEKILHEHVNSCLHKHIGVSTTYGGCYTKAAICGSTDICKQEARRTFYYGNVAEDGSHIFCVRCGSDYCPGHLDIYYNYNCRVCGANGMGDIKVCTAVTAYEPNCGLGESYNCGMAGGQLLSAEPGYGGSNYVNIEACMDYRQEAGVKQGNGSFSIASKQVNLMEDNLLTGVAATDVSAPEMINAASVVKTAIGAEEIRIAFEKPQDNGTAYYHMVESYNKATNEKLCTSNQTKNILTSGVTGYYYVLDNHAETKVNKKHTHYAEEGEIPFLTVPVSAELKYLHVAATDRAGNIGKPIHIPISSQELIYWPLITEKIVLEEGSHIYPAAARDTYYVKADGSTPVKLNLEGLLCGTARMGYQINQADFQVNNLSNASQIGVLSVIVPNREKVEAGVYSYPMSRLQKKQENLLGLQDASYTVAKRFNMCKSLGVEQKLTLPNSLDGQLFKITPRVAAVGEKDTIWSLEEADQKNGVYLLADGRGPEIRGLEELENWDISEMEDEESRTLDIYATDTGSGLAEFYVEIRNMDNGMVVRHTDYARTGKLSIEISLMQEIYQGEFSVQVYAKDFVGNESSAQSSMSQVALSAYVQRVLEPHTPVFKKGESGVLYVETLGYVEKVVVSFPTAFTEADASLNRTFLYGTPVYMQAEEIPFVVPFSVPEGELTIKVTAYKNGTQLETEPKLVTIKVKGSILDELHTRLR